MGKGKVVEEAIENLTNAKVAGKKITNVLESNKSINTAFNFLYEGGSDAIKTGKKILSGDGVMNSISDVYKNEDQWRWGAIAGSAVAVGAAGRIVSGGGLLKDSSGNNNIIGIPGI